MIRDEVFDIPGLMGYYITRQGNVYAMNRQREYRELKPYYKNGCVAVVINHMFINVNTLVTMTFLGPCPKDYYIDYKDGNKHNNNIDNLHYVKINKCSQKGEDNPSSKLTEQDVISILMDKENTKAELGRQYNVSRSIISLIKSGKKWGHLYKRIHGEE